MGGLTQPATFAQGRAGSAPSLRPYQVEAIAAIRSELARVQSTMFNACTGAGKTVVLADLSRLCVTGSLFGMPGRVLILVHRDELVRQTVRKCESVGLFADVEKGSERANVFAKVVIASVQTLRGKRLLRWARDHFALVIVDECHHAAAKSYIDVLAHFVSAKRVGVTATPKRADGKALGEIFDTVAYTYDIKRAIAEQFLVPIVARRIVIDSVDLRETKTSSSSGDFIQEDLAKAMDTEQALRGVAVPLLDNTRDLSTIAFCVSVKHAQDLADMLNRYRPGCARAVWGDMDEDLREYTLEAHANGEFQYLTNCNLLEEGYDSPRAACVAMVAPTMSWGKYVQRAGRGLRLLGSTFAESVANGKSRCVLLDFTGTAGKHALIGPADCLCGANDNIPDDVRAEIERLLESGQLDLATVTKQAADEVRARRLAMRIEAVVKYHTMNIDPFIGRDPTVATRQRSVHDLSPPSKQQLVALEQQGVTVSKLPSQFTAGDADHLLRRLATRHKAGLAPYRQAKKIHDQTKKFCTLDVANMPIAVAKRLYSALREGGWHFTAIEDDPEVLASHEQSKLARLADSAREFGGAA